MVLTRPSTSLALTRFIRISRCFSTSTCSDASSANPTTPKYRKARQIHRKKYSDLPVTYISPTGVPAAPLGEWFAGADDQFCSISSQPTIFQKSLAGIPELWTEESENKAKNQRCKRNQNTDGQGDTFHMKIPRAKKSKRKIHETIGGEPQVQINESATTAIKPVKSSGFLAQEILANLKRFPHCLLLTRVGQFYESYFDQAVEISRLLNIKLTSRKWNGERIAMCGFPLMHLDRHLKTLVQLEKRFVAMCEEFPRYTNSGSKQFDRRVNRVITPGTLIDESFVNPLENNYLLAISLSKQNEAKDPVGLAWIDISTGEFFSEKCAQESLRDEVARLAPREIVLDNVFKTLENHPFFSSLAEDRCLISYTSSTHVTNPDKGENATMAPSPDSSIKASSKNGLTDLDIGVKQYIANLTDHVEAGSLTLEETSAISLLTAYLEETMLEHMPLLISPSQEGVQERMQIDAHTIKGLEIRESVYDGGTKGSLLSVVKRTVTNGGTRLLARWLCSPSTSVTEINARQSLVAFFSCRSHFRVDVCEILKAVDDVGRLCQKFLLGRADFTDLVAIHASIEVWTNLNKQFQQEKASENTERPRSSVRDEWKALDTLFSQMCSLDTLSSRISKAIFSDGITKTCDAEQADGNITEEETVFQSLFPDKGNYKWAINPNFSEKLSSLHSLFENLLQQKKKLERELQSRYDASSLTLRSSPGQGMFVHLAKAKRDRKRLDLDPTFHSLTETGTTKSYFHQPWSELGNKITEASIALTLAEKEVLQMLRLEIVQHSSQLRQNAQVIDELDVLLSFATLAVEMNFVRPVMMDNDSYRVINGRHPSVEMGLLSSGRQFTPNSVEMTSSSKLHIITGPNMAGKSTFLRQTALIAILAQVGSFVPADSAHVGVVDRLFSRIGAKDDLFRDRSTFMVEMVETADILRRATPKSLVIMDEVGRGTTVKDGLAISFATLHHLASINKSRCLFATHFHELADMVDYDNGNGQGLFHNVRFYCSDINDTEDGHFIYSYRLRPGINRNSHGLKVAQLAGMPPVAMTVAANALSQLKERT